MDKVSQYIVENWDNTVQAPENLKGNIRIKKPFMSPSISGIFQDLYYWDIYFINLGLFLDDRIDLVENNLENIATFIEELGFMPNANIILDRTQPPFFTRGVWDLYNYKKDVEVIKKYLPTILKEYDFFQKNRMTEIGLNAYGTHGSLKEIQNNYNWWSHRVQETSDNPETQIQIGKDIMAIAESGLDFNMRFKTKDSKIAAHEFAHLDLNCILFDVENKISSMFEILGQKAEAEQFKEYANKRKELVNKYFFDKESGIYWDYNFEKDCFSTVLTAASLYPYFFGVSDDGISAKKVLERLELEKGLSVGEYRGEDIYYQWDYPCMWPYTTYMVYIALMNVGLKEDARRIAKKYQDAVAINFETTGKIFEKYDARDGSIAVTSEYETPEMMGWSAAIYRVFHEELKNKKWEF